LYLAGRSHGSSSRSGIGWCDLPWDLASNSLEDIVDDIGDRKMFFQRRWAGRYIVMGTTRQTPCRFSGPALRYGEPVGKQALIQEARPDPRFHDPRFQVMTPGFPGLGGRTGHQPASWAAIMELCRSVFADNNRCRADLTSSLRGRRIAAVIGNIETGICRSVYLMVRRIVSDIRRRRRSEP